MTTLRHGTCLCGQVQVALHTAPLVVAACHCRHCRKTSGSAFSLVAVMLADGVEVTGPVAEYLDTADSGTAVTRRFCAACGSPVETASAETAKQGTRLVKLGLFDELDELVPRMELFCGGRVGWLPAFSETQTFAAMPAPQTR
jgi:hypothetical protein